VLNVGFEATSGLKLGNDYIEFKARFGGVSRDIVVPVDHVVAIYARENGQGMAFPVPTEAPAAAPAAAAPRAEADPPARGLRLASSDETPDAPAEAPAPRTGWTDETPPPDGSPPASGGRPSLKRIK
jgi:stringent starvation protein B